MPTTHFVERLGARAKTMSVGPGVSDPDIGPIISKRQLETIERYVAVGKEEGADRRGRRRTSGECRTSGGFYFEPTLLDGVTPDMRVAQEEIFGPVLAIIDFDDIEEAAVLANHSAIRPRLRHLDARHQQGTGARVADQGRTGLRQHVRRRRRSRAAVRRLQEERYGREKGLESLPATRR